MYAGLNPLPVRDAKVRGVVAAFERGVTTSLCEGPHTEGWGASSGRPRTVPYAVDRDAAKKARLRDSGGASQANMLALSANQ